MTSSVGRVACSRRNSIRTAEDVCPYSENIFVLVHTNVIILRTMFIFDCRAKNACRFFIKVL